jgi:hypothetical protein
MVILKKILYKIKKNKFIKLVEKKVTKLYFSYERFLKLKDYRLLLLKIAIINIKLNPEKQINIIYNDKKFYKEIELYITLLILLFIFF